jgi:hypothetical protein
MNANTNVLNVMVLKIYLSNHHPIPFLISFPCILAFFPNRVYNTHQRKNLVRLLISTFALSYQLVTRHFSTNYRTLEIRLEPYCI